MRCLRQAAPPLRVAQPIAQNTRCCLVVVEKSLTGELTIIIIAQIESHFPRFRALGLQ